MITLDKLTLETGSPLYCALDSLNAQYGRGDILNGIKLQSYTGDTAFGSLWCKLQSGERIQRQFRIRFNGDKATLFACGHRKTIDLSPDAESNRLCKVLEKEICALLKSLKADIGDDYRASDDPEDDIPGMQITVATRNLEQWNYQTGDNSYTGACYSLPHWGVGSLYRRTNCKELAADLVNQMAEQVAACGEGVGE